MSGFRGRLLMAFLAVALLPAGRASAHVASTHFHQLSYMSNAPVWRDRIIPGREWSKGQTGQLRTILGRTRVHGHGKVHRFRVRVEGGLRVNPMSFAATVQRILFSPRGWTKGGRVAFKRVSSGPVDFRVILAGPKTTDRLCAPAQTRGRLSCHNQGRVVLNYWRWINSAAAYRHDLRAYRIYLVNHEVGHALGHHGHPPCPGLGQPAPVMMQQTLGVGACRPQSWPLASERG